MSQDWTANDLARLIALEHAFGAVALIAAANFARGADLTPSQAVERFREGAVAAVPQGAGADDLNHLVHEHLERMFAHVAGMAQRLS